MQKNPFILFELDSSTQQLDSAKRILKELNDMMDEEFWNSLSNLASQTFGARQQAKQAGRGQHMAERIPAEIWEAERQLYLLLAVPGLKSQQDVRITFMDTQSLQIEAPSPQLQPVKGSILLQSEFPKGAIVRKIDLPCPVSARSYSASCKNGILTIVLNKAEEEKEILSDLGE